MAATDRARMADFVAENRRDLARTASLLTDWWRRRRFETVTDLTAPAPCPGPGPWRTPRASTPSRTAT